MDEGFEGTFVVGMSSPAGTAWVTAASGKHLCRTLSMAVFQSPTGRCQGITVCH